MVEPALYPYPRTSLNDDTPGNSAWSAYWYDGFIYGNDIPRGFDIYLLSDPVRAGARKVGAMNPQTQ